MASPVREASPTGHHTFEEGLPIDVFFTTPLDKDGGHVATISMDVGLSGSHFSLSMDVPAAELQHALRKFLDSMDRHRKSERKSRRSRQKAKSPDSGSSSSRGKHAKSPERASSSSGMSSPALDRSGRTEHVRTSSSRAASPPARAASPVRANDSGADPTTTCRGLDEMVARNMNRALLIPYALDECFKFLMRSALKTRGLFLEPLSSKSQLSFDRYLRLIYRGQSINAIDEATRTHYEEPNLVAHVLLRVFRDLPKPLLSQQDVEALTTVAIGAHMQTATQQLFASGTHESRLLFAFLQLLWSVRANKRANGVSVRRLTSVVAPSLVRRGDVSNVLYLLVRNGQNYLYQTALDGLNAHARHFTALTSRYPQLARLLLQTDMALFRVLTDVVEPSLASTLSPAILRFLKLNACAVVSLARLIEKELSENTSPSTYFRANNLATQLLTLYCKEEGRPFLEETLSPLLHQLCKVDGSFEVKPAPGLSDGDIQENQQRLHAYLALVFNMIVTSLADLPERFSPGIGQIAYQMQSLVNDQNNKDLLVGSFIFLRFLCPAIVSPEGFDLIETGMVKPHVRSGLISISKVLQNMANRTRLKEQHMHFLQPFIDENMAHLCAAFAAMCLYGESHPITESLPLLPTADFETCLMIHQYLAENLADVDEAVREMRSPEVVRTFKEVQMLLCEMPAPPPVGSELSVAFQSLPCPELRVKVFSQSALAIVAFCYDANGQTYWSADADGRIVHSSPHGALQSIKTGVDGISAMLCLGDCLWICCAVGLLVWHVPSAAVVHQPIVGERCTSIVANDAHVFVGGAGKVWCLPVAIDDTLSSSSSAIRHIAVPARSTAGPVDNDVVRKLVVDQFGALWVLQKHCAHVVDAARLTKRAVVPFAPSVDALLLLVVGDKQTWLVSADGVILLLDAQNYQTLREARLDFLGAAQVSAACVLGNFALIGLDDGRLGMMDTLLLTVSKNVPHVLTVRVAEIHPIWNATQQHWELWTWSADGSYCSWIPYSQESLRRPTVDYVPAPAAADIRSTLSSSGLASMMSPSSSSASSSSSSSSSSQGLGGSSGTVPDSVRLTVQYKATDPRNPLSSSMKTVQLNFAPKKTVRELIVAVTQQLHMQGKKDFQEILLLDSECAELEENDVFMNVWKKGDVLTAELF